MCSPQTGEGGLCPSELSSSPETAQGGICMTCKDKMTGRKNKDGFPQSAHPESDFCTKLKFGIVRNVSNSFFHVYIWGEKNQQDEWPLAIDVICLPRVQNHLTGGYCLSRKWGSSSPWLVIRKKQSQHKVYSMTTESLCQHQVLSFTKVFSIFPPLCCWGGHQAMHDVNSR